MRRFFLSDTVYAGDRVILTGTEARHIGSVLRLKPGHKVELFDGKGNVHTAVLESMDKSRVTLAIEASRMETSGGRFPLTLAQCLLKGKKMDLLVQKATELGVHAFLPVVSRYCENQGERSQQHERWQRIMIEACKQCHRATPMAILPVTLLTQVDFTSFRHRLMAWEEERATALPNQFAEQPGAICLLLGPEGGFNADDLRIARQSDFTAFSLGPLILRGETAALAATSIIRYLSGGLQPVGSEQAITDTASA
jgi:16S rRNA (uracil1498-N3)-methyltransferase